MRQHLHEEGGYGNFVRCFVLPQDADARALTATLELGVLESRITRRQKPVQTIEIRTQ